MTVVQDIFLHGPESAKEWFAAESTRHAPPMDIKELADVCWTRASTLVRKDAEQARPWAQAALAGYELLSGSSNPMIAESAAENADALRGWKLLARSSVT